MLNANNNCWHFNINKHDKFYAQWSWVQTKFYNLGGCTQSHLYYSSLSRCLLSLLYFTFPIISYRGAELLAVNADGNMPYDICEDKVAPYYVSLFLLFLTEVLNCWQWTLMVTCPMIYVKTRLLSTIFLFSYYFLQRCWIVGSERWW